jgi:hypothetical protein
MTAARGAPGCCHGCELLSAAGAVVRHSCKAGTSCCVRVSILVYDQTCVGVVVREARNCAATDRPLYDRSTPTADREFV